MLRKNLALQGLDTLEDRHKVGVDCMQGASVLRQIAGSGGERGRRLAVEVLELVVCSPKHGVSAKDRLQSYEHQASQMMVQWRGEFEEQAGQEAQYHLSDVLMRA